MSAEGLQTVRGSVTGFVDGSEGPILVPEICIEALSHGHSVLPLTHIKLPHHAHLQVFGWDDTFPDGFTARNNAGACIVDRRRSGFPVKTSSAGLRT